MVAHMKPELRSALLLAVADEFRKGRITEMHLDEGDDKAVWEGVCERNGHIYIDPLPATLDVAVHECLHRRFPRWGEARVSKTAERLVFGMSPADRRKMFALYSRVVKRRKGVRKVDE